jgi:alpha-glucosidase (family GH31 glycosyl hydrolase)
MMRYAEYAAVHPSMSFGYGPWSLGRKDVIEVTRNAAQLHHRLTPYIYSAALQAAETGFPYTMTPLPLAYPEDPEVYGLANTTRRSYQWLLGESLMAVPLYGDDYATANSRDVYLPEGRWVEYDTGRMFTGPKTLDDYPLPIGKTPLFVGGKGIVIEEKFGRLLARIYPVKNETEFFFRDKDGKASRITVKVDNWAKSPVQVRCGGRLVLTESQRGAIVFPIDPGTDYQVVSIRMPKPASLVKPSKRKESLPE